MSGSFLTGVMRAVSSIPSTVEGMVRGPQGSLSRSPQSMRQNVESYASAQSASPGDRGGPPSAGQVPRTPLFDMDRLNELLGEAPHLYVPETLQHSTGRTSSTPSSDIQAEVRRQLAEYMAMHEDESLRLRRQVEVLAHENRELRRRSEVRVVHLRVY